MVMRSVIGAQSTVTREQRFLTSLPVRDAFGGVVSYAFGRGQSDSWFGHYPMEVRVVGAHLVMTIDAYSIEQWRPGVSFDVEQRERMKIEVQVEASREAYYHLHQLYRLCHRLQQAQGQSIMSLLTGFTMQLALARRFNQCSITVGSTEPVMHTEFH